MSIRLKSVASHATLRDGLVEALSEARTILASQGRPSGLKAMGALAGTAPSRISELASAEFFLDLGGAESVRSDHAVRKAIVGFASSLYKVIEWLTQVLPNELADRALGALVMQHGARSGRTVNSEKLVALIGEFWPVDSADYQLGDQRCQYWIEQGISQAQGEVARVTSLSIEVAVVEWGPFSTPVLGHSLGSSRRQSALNTEDQYVKSDLAVLDTPIGNYGSSLLATIDPIQFRADVDGLFVRKSLQAALSGLPSSKAGKWQVALGVYDSLYRQYEGYRFVTLPIRTPIMAIEFCSDHARNGQPDTVFETIDFSRYLTDLCNKDSEKRVFVVPKESGHLAVGRFLESESISELSEYSDDPASIFEQISTYSDGNDSALFISDTIMCCELYKHARSLSAGKKLRLIFQDRPSEFSFRIGFMVREEDEKLLRMLSLAQREMFRSPAKVKNLILHLSEATAIWANGLSWDSPFFVIDREGLEEFSRDSKEREQIIDFINGLKGRFFHVED